jgi:hypothetical protein
VDVLPPRLLLYAYSRSGSRAGSSGRFAFGPVGIEGFAVAETLPFALATGTLLKFSVDEVCGGTRRLTP